MKEAPLFVVDAFACEAFEGNPAAVMPITFALDDALRQKIALENNLSETAFIVGLRATRAPQCTPGVRARRGPPTGSHSVHPTRLRIAGGGL